MSLKYVYVKLTSAPFKFLEDLPDDIYCNLVTTLREKCVTVSWHLKEIHAEITLCPVEPSGDVEVQRGSNRGSDHGGGDRGGEQAGAQARIPKIFELSHDWGKHCVFSPWFGFSRNFSSLLGGVTKNSSGHIIAATSALMVWVLEVRGFLGGNLENLPAQVDPSSVSRESAGLSAELGLADPASLAWEDALVATALNLSTPEIRWLSIGKICFFL